MPASASGKAHKWSTGNGTMGDERTALAVRDDNRGNEWQQHDKLVAMRTCAAEVSNSPDVSSPLRAVAVLGQNAGGKASILHQVVSSPRLDRDGAGGANTTKEGSGKVSFIKSRISATERDNINGGGNENDAVEGGNTRPIMKMKTLGGGAMTPRSARRVRATWTSTDANTAFSLPIVSGEASGDGSMSDNKDVRQDAGQKETHEVKGKLENGKRHDSIWRCLTGADAAASPLSRRKGGLKVAGEGSSRQSDSSSQASRGYADAKQLIGKKEEDMAFGEASRSGDGEPWLVKQEESLRLWLRGVLADHRGQGRYSRSVLAPDPVQEARHIMQSDRFISVKTHIEEAIRKKQLYMRSDIKLNRNIRVSEGVFNTFNCFESCWVSMALDALCGTHVFKNTTDTEMSRQVKAAFKENILSVSSPLRSLNRLLQVLLLIDMCKTHVADAGDASKRRGVLPHLLFRKDCGLPMADKSMAHQVKALECLGVIQATGTASEFLLNSCHFDFRSACQRRCDEVGMEIESLRTGLRDGIVLAQLADVARDRIVTGSSTSTLNRITSGGCVVDGMTLPTASKSGAVRPLTAAEMAGNVRKALGALMEVTNMHNLLAADFTHGQIRPVDIVDGHLEKTLSVVWRVLQYMDLPHVD